MVTVFMEVGFTVCGTPEHPEVYLGSKKVTNNIPVELLKVLIQVMLEERIGFNNDDEEEGESA